MAKSQHAAQHEDDLRALERFIVDNEDLMKLESQIGRFNVFDALRIARVEIRHSNFLGFILDPGESHGQGSLFLRAFLMDLLRTSPVESRPLSPIEIDGAELRGVEIRREWKHIDLLILCKIPEFAIVIENKVDSSEHSNQLERYKRTVQEHFPDVPVLYVFLTPDGEEASDESWAPYSYGQIHDALLRVRDTNNNSIGEEVLVFLNHYLNLLRTRFMNDEELDALCRKIYKNHRQALDVIWERAGDPESKALEVLANIIEEDSRWEEVSYGNANFEFFPTAWREWLPPVDGYFQFYIFVRLWEDKLTLIPTVGRMRDDETRTRIITELRQQCPSCGFKPTTASSIRGRGNRIAARETLATWSDEEELESDSFRETVAAKLDDLYTRVEKLAGIFKRLCEDDAS